MEVIDKTVLKLINLTFTGAELEAHLKAFEKYPVYKTDCRTTRMFKQMAMGDYAKKLLKENQ